MQLKFVKVKVKNITKCRNLVRAGGTGGMPPVNFSHRVAATRQIRQKQQSTLQFLVFLYISTHCSLTVHPSFETHGEGPAMP